MTKICTTLNKIRTCHPCEDGWVKLLAYLGKTKADDEPLAFSTILKSNGLEDALWTLRSAPEYNNQWRLMAVRFAREVQHLMKDARSIEALDVAEMHSKGEATDEELTIAREDARKAAWSAGDAAAWAAAWADDTVAGQDDALIAVQAASWGAARAAACAKRRAATLVAARIDTWFAGQQTAFDVEWTKARDAALDGALIKQAEIFLEFVK
jgi:hypothetical protein